MKFSALEILLECPHTSQHLGVPLSSQALLCIFWVVISVSPQFHSVDRQLLNDLKITFIFTSLYFSKLYITEATVKKTLLSYDNDKK